MILALLLAAQAAPIFQDRTKEFGLALADGPSCWIDYDNDGWPDLCVGGTLWHNDKGKGFTRVQDGLGSVVAADFDNDGYPDLFSYSEMKLWHNDHGKGFTEVKLPPLPPTSSCCACWGDFNGDGYVDLYVGGYEDWNNDVTYPSFILMNAGGKSFKLVWSDARYRTRGATACDFRHLGRLDVYVSNYRLQPNELWLNDGRGDFKDGATDYNAVATSPGFDGGHSVGACWGDFDNDGEFDLFAGNFAHRDERGDQPKSRFLRNMGPRFGYRFEDMGTCGVFYQESYATPAAGDFDNDGNLDLFFTTVYGTASFGRPNFPVLFKNNGNWVFTDATAQAGLSNLDPTYQAAWADFNHDGQLDLVAGGHLCVNRGNSNHWIEVRLSGDGKTVNRSAIGAQVRIRIGSKILARQVEAGTGQGNQNDLTLQFGLGSYAGPVDLDVFWPNGKTQVVRHERTNRIVGVAFAG